MNLPVTMNRIRQLKCEIIHEDLQHVQFWNQVKTFPDPLALPRPIYARAPNSAHVTIEMRGSPFFNVRAKMLGAFLDKARPSETLNKTGEKESPRRG